MKNRPICTGIRFDLLLSCRAGNARTTLFFFFPCPVEKDFLCAAMNSLCLPALHSLVRLPLSRSICHPIDKALKYPRQSIILFPWYVVLQHSARYNKISTADQFNADITKTCSATNSVLFSPPPPPPHTPPIIQISKQSK